MPSSVAAALAPECLGRLDLPVRRERLIPFVRSLSDHNEAICCQRRLVGEHSAQGGQCPLVPYAADDVVTLHWLLSFVSRLGLN